MQKSYKKEISGNYIYEYREYEYFTTLTVTPIKEYKNE